jgi:hypothetical protein
LITSNGPDWVAQRDRGAAATSSLFIIETRPSAATAKTPLGLK